MSLGGVFSLKYSRIIIFLFIICMVFKACSSDSDWIKRAEKTPSTRVQKQLLEAKQIFLLTPQPKLFSSFSQAKGLFERSSFEFHQTLWDLSKENEEKVSKNRMNPKRLMIHVWSLFVMMIPHQRILL